VDSPRARAVMTKLYSPICNDSVPLMFTTYESAELIKYAANSLLATKIAFINEMADICEKTGANIRDISRGIGLDKRIGDKFLQPGPGYGGSCFPKDTMALKSIAQTAGVPSRIVEATIATNSARKNAMVEKIIAANGGTIAGKIIAVLGVTFKPGTDDMRDSASLVIIPALQEAGALIRAYDPQGMKEAEKHLSSVSWGADAYSIMQDADMLLILTEWNEFKSLEMKRVKSLLAKALIIDLRNIYKRQEMKTLGFRYVSIGRQEVIPGEPWISDLNIDDEKVA
jgi:UDPglucose 6-dehydrogenase